MSVDFSDPHWAYVSAAYLVAAVGVLGLVVQVWRRLAFWRKRARDAERQP